MQTKAHSKRTGSWSGTRPCDGQRHSFVDGPEESRDQSGLSSEFAPNTRSPTRTGCDAQTGRAWRRWMLRARGYSLAARLDPGQRCRRVHHCLPRFQIVDLQYDTPPNYPRLRHQERMFRMIWPMILLAWLVSSASS